MVSVTYGHGKLYEFEEVSDWSEYLGVGGGSFESDGSVVTMTKTDSNLYYISNDTDIDLSSTIYPKIIGRYKTSSTSIKTGVLIEFDDATWQWILGSDSSSTTWKTFTDTIVTGKTIDHIRLYANNAAGTVDYEFTLIHKGTFTFPEGQPVTMNFNPSSRYATLPVPGRIGDITQYMGSGLASWNMTCDLNIGSWKRTIPADTIDGEVFINIHHNAKTEPWQWLDTETEQCKVTLDEPIFRRQAGRSYLDLHFKEYRENTASAETHDTRYGINL
jgi:hypothetical protein